MLRFSDLSVDDYVLWGYQKTNMDGDYDLEFCVRQLTLGDFVFMEENMWEERDLNEFVKPIEITRELMDRMPDWTRDEEWNSAVRYSLERPVSIRAKAIDSDQEFSFDVTNSITVAFGPHRCQTDIEANCVNENGKYELRRRKYTEPLCLHELQHVMRECGMETTFAIDDIEAE